MAERQRSEPQRTEVGDPEVRASEDGGQSAKREKKNEGEKAPVKYALLVTEVSSRNSCQTR